MENCATAKVYFTKLKGFQKLNTDDKIETQAFLSAVEEIVQVIENFGRLFTPVTSDMRANIRKLNLIYQKYPKKFAYIDHIENNDLRLEFSDSIEPLTWLNRALNLIFIFFKNILNDITYSESLRDHLKDAYNKTLKQYHGIIVKHTVTFIYRWVPNRSQLLGLGDLHDENIKSLSNLLNVMEKHLERTNMLLNDFPKST